MAVNDLFVYGTLRFGDVRWQFLEPYVVDRGLPDVAAGRLFDTGFGYPAAIFEPKAAKGDVIIGHRYRLTPSKVEIALSALDEIESAVTGRYRRIRIITGAGVEAWAYEYGLELDDPTSELWRIPSGDWYEFCNRGGSH
jgi:gamma-glutamylcyclotransferase (GGCT)/AIG2-like uncharacterized protein YtfP